LPLSHALFRADAMASAGSYDVIIVGAGIVGAASAWQLLKQKPDSRVLILEKEAAPARHQSGRNSGVLHAGVYYPAGSLKARMCREGLQQTEAFCREHQLPFSRCGKWIVATNAHQLRGLGELQQRAKANGLNPEWLVRDAMREQEPELRGEAALAVSESAIVDYSAICQALLDQAQAAGAELKTEAEVLGITESQRDIRVFTRAGEFTSSQLLCCAGLMADRLAKLQGLDCPLHIVPFRGEFYQLAARCESWVSRLIYPVPDPALPFLGVHLTPRVDGRLLAGPNAVLALAREGYRWSDVEWRSLAELIGFRGFWALVRRHHRAAVSELHNSLSKRRYLQLLQAYYPSLTMDDLSPAPAGVRAQAVSPKGELLHDFAFLESRRSVHVINAPSPAATSALPIGRHLVERLLQH